MGVDFIRSQSGKPYNKRWDRGVDRLKEPSLFDVNFNGDCRFVTLTCENTSASKVGRDLILQLDESGSCTAFDGLLAIGTLEQPPASVVTFLTANSGIAPVTVDRIGALGGTIEVRLP